MSMGTLPPRIEPPRGVDATLVSPTLTAQALNALSRAPRMAMLRSLRGESRRIASEIYEAAGLSVQEGLPHLLALQEMGVIREDHGAFSLDVEALNRLLQGTSLTAPKASRPPVSPGREDSGSVA